MGRSSASLNRRDVRARIKRAIDTWAASSEQSAAVCGMLRSEAYPLHPHARLRAGALSALAYDIADGGDANRKATAAAVSELFMAAGFMLDDVMDEDIPPGGSVGKLTAVGLATLLISQSALDDAGRPLAAGLQLALAHTARRLVLDSCESQNREMNLRGDLTGILRMSTDDAMTLTQGKAGSLGELCAVIGIGVAGYDLDTELALALRRCYFHLFTYLQIVDDLADAVSTNTGKVGDIRGLRPTLPTIFYHKSKAELGASTNAEPGRAPHRMEILDEDVEPTEQDLAATGTTLFAQLAAETQRNRAIQLAQRIESERGASGLLATIGASSSEGGSQDITGPTSFGPPRES